MNKKTLFITLGICSMIFSGWVGWEGREFFNDIDSIIISEEGATQLNETWGDFYIYTDEAKVSTYGTKNTLTGVAAIKPGMEIHPPHQHTAEEFLYVIEGTGTWSLNGVESEAKAGDMLYAKPWDLHGISNTGDKTLRFFVMKWDSKGMEIPVLQE